MLRLILTSIALGVGLAMDATAVSIANGLKYPKMEKKWVLIMSFAFGIFQGAMPLIGYFVGNAILSYIEKFIPWIALILLGFLGAKMIVDGIKNKEGEEGIEKIAITAILVQAIATSIDALTVGFTIANYKISQALICTGIIATITFVICLLAVKLGKKFGEKLENKAIIFGGIILLIIGLEIFITGLIS